MKELTAINGLYAALQAVKKRDGYLTDIGNNVQFGRAYYNGVDDLPMTVVAPGDADSINNQVGPPQSTEYNMTLPMIVECHIEQEPTSVDTLYLAWRDITRAVLLWRPVDPSQRITLTYSGKSVTYPDESNRIAVLQVRFNLQYIEDLTTI